MKMTLISEERFKELEEAEAEVDDLKYDLEQTERENRILRKRLELKSRAQAQVSPMTHAGEPKNIIVHELTITGGARGSLASARTAVVRSTSGTGPRAMVTPRSTAHRPAVGSGERARPADLWSWARTSDTTGRSAIEPRSAGRHTEWRALPHRRRRRHLPGLAGGQGKPTTKGGRTGRREQRLRRDRGLQRLRHQGVVGQATASGGLSQRAERGAAHHLGPQEPRNQPGPRGQPGLPSWDGWRSVLARMDVVRFHLTLGTDWRRIPSLRGEEG